LGPGADDCSDLYKLFHISFLWMWQSIPD